MGWGHDHGIRAQHRAAWSDSRQIHIEICASYISYASNGCHSALHGTAREEMCARNHVGEWPIFKLFS
jgi:hypothetical protein